MNQSTSPESHDVAEASLVAGGSLVIGLGLAALLLLGFAVVAFSFGRTFFVHLDHSALRGAYDLRVNDAWLWRPMLALTNLGSVTGFTLQTIIGVLLLLALRPVHWRSDLILLLVGIIGVALLNTALKYSFARLRPSLFASPFALRSYSFPSGHSMSSAAFYGIAAMIGLHYVRTTWRRWLIVSVAALLPVAIGLSRMFFSVHYPTDVLGGFAAGTGWALVIYTARNAIRWRAERNRVVPATADDLQPLPDRAPDATMSPDYRADQAPATPRKR